MRCSSSSSTIIFFLLGIGVLLPWNAYISAKPYFVQRLEGAGCDDNDDTDDYPVEAWFSVLFNGGSVLSLVLLLLLQWVTTRGTSSSSAFFVQEYPLVMIPLGLYLVVFVGTTLWVFFPGSSTRLFELWTLGGFAVCGICTSVASSGIVGTAAGLNDDADTDKEQEHVAIHAYFQGQAMGGLIVAVGSLVANYYDDSGNTESASCQEYSSISWPTAGYFGASCLVLAACMVGYAHVVEHQQPQPSTPKEQTPLLLLQPPGDATDEERDDSPGFYYYGTYKTTRLAEEDTASTTSSSDASSSVSYEALEEQHQDCFSWRQVMPLIQGPAWCLFGTYFVTLTIFPVWTSELTSYHYDEDSSLWERFFHGDLYTPMTFVVFNAADLLGRILSSIDVSSTAASRRMVLLALARLFLLGLFLQCSSTFQQQGRGDTYSWILQWILGISNGYLTNIAFTSAASSTTNIAGGNYDKTQQQQQQLQQVISATLNTSLCLGMWLGGMASFYYLQVAATAAASTGAAT